MILELGSASLPPAKACRGERVRQIVIVFAPT
jgi:hypothetical protein